MQDIKQYRKQYREKNKEKHRLQGIAYRLANADKIKAKRKIYYVENKKDIQERGAKYRANNKELLKSQRALKKEHRKNYYHLNFERLKPARLAQNRTLKGRWRGFKSRAKQRNKPLSINFIEFQELLSKPCNYCGGPLPEAGCGLDRVDNDGGYSIDNIVPCCDRCNRMFLNIPKLEAIEHMKLIINFWKGNKNE